MTSGFQHVVNEVTYLCHLKNHLKNSVRGSGKPRSTPAKQVHFWIDSREGFRVYKHIYKTPYNRVEITSSYRGKAGVPIPSEATVRNFNRGGSLVNETTVRVTRANWGCPVDADVGTLESLDIPAGTPVTDERIHLRIGYWDGEKLTEEFTDAMKVGKQRKADERKREVAVRWGIGLPVALAVLAAVAYVYRRRTRAASP